MNNTGTAPTNDQRAWALLLLLLLVQILETLTDSKLIASQNKKIRPDVSAFNPGNTICT